MPARGDRNAPTFDSTKPRELPRYFSDLEFHFTRCTITDTAEKKSHATRFLSVRDQDAWEALAEFTTDTNTYADFKSAVLKLKYSLGDLDALIGAHARTGILSKGDFSEFYRDFSSISTYLIVKTRLSAAEQSHSFRRAMQPQSLWDRMHQRLQIKKPDVHLEDPYDLVDLKEAADFVLEGTSIATTSSDSSPPTTQHQTKQEPDAATLVTTVVTQLFDALAKIASDAQAGRCKRNINGRVVLPSGMFVPREVPGRNLRERMEEWHRANPGQITVPQMMLGTHANYVYAQPLNRLTIEERQKHNVFDRSMNVPVTISHRELLSIAPDVRAQYKEATTGRRIITDAPAAPAVQLLTTTTEPVLPQGALIANDDFATLYEAGVSPNPGELAVAVDSCAIRSVVPIIDNQQRIECIYDTGSQIVAISEAVCNELQLPYNLRITINMESANGSISPSLGLARNLILVRAPAYDVLLGRPFDQLTESKVVNSANGDQTITIIDRNTGLEQTIPTVPRGRARERSQNFRVSRN
ncbi:hypothetical protein B0H17DRAFT_1163367 [Mycena rosella]|uniref:Uncharacterized protein n=1 Tax=Mycena rosella TaxID=1033263 RepID=A0AAD7G3R1_MYCRO|nr:hypothetical protein B0H17DRAFT_1163367 [Mycena rosella]